MAQQGLDFPTPYCMIDMKQQVISDKACAPSSCYSQAIISGGCKRLYQSSLAPHIQSDHLPQTIEGQTSILLENIKEMLEDQDFSLKDIVKVQLYLKNDRDRSGCNAVYSQMMPQPWPARSVMIVPDLETLLEIDLIAEKD